jgi:predicted TIM-barrel fold metal-dependent hydrolase
MDLDEMAGGGSPEQRIEEQDQDGVDAEILFADVGGRNDWSAIDDDDSYHAIVHAYNEFLAEEYCAVDPRRLIGMGIIPERGIDQAIAEMEYCAKAGFKGINLNTYPSGKPRVTAEDDRFWAAAVDLDMPVTVHTAFAATRRERGPGDGTPDLARRICTYGVKAAPIAAALAVYGIFERFPKLQVYFAENQICWVPGFMDSMDVLYKKHRYYHERVQGLKLPSHLPGEIVKEHCLWGFMDDRVGVELRHYIGVDKVLWSSDFPHAPSDWPHSMDVVERIFAGVPEDEKHQMAAGNCVRFFHLEDYDRSLAESREHGSLQQSAISASQREG